MAEIPVPVSTGTLNTETLLMLTGDFLNGGLDQKLTKKILSCSHLLLGTLPQADFGNKEVEYLCSGY
jgi:hypothetical protein